MKSFRSLLRVLGLLCIANSGVAIVEAQTPAVRIMPLGDSLTSGTTIEGAYRNKLHDLLSTAGYNVDFVGTLSDANNPTLPDRDHQGMGGYRIDQLQSGLPSWLGVIEDPDVVLLMIGTNDFSANFNVSSAHTRLANLVTDVATRLPFAKIIVSNLPLRTDNAGLEALQATFNAAVPGIVSNQVSLGRQVYFLDMRSALLAGDFEEGVHPSAAGYEKMAAAWFPSISNVITPLGTSNAPAIVRTEAPADLQHIALTFSKPLADSSANPANFSINGGLSVSQAVLDPVSKRTITLTTPVQTPGALYTLTVSGVRDRTPQQNEITAGSTVNYAVPTLINGGFEDGEAGWTFAGNCFVYDGDSSYVASEGTRMVVMNGGQSVPNAVISQTFATVPGQSYLLDFNIGILAANFSAQSLRVEIGGASPLVSNLETWFGNGLGNSVWNSRSYPFVADSATTTLTFRDQSSTSNLVDLLLDHVRITATPTPVNTAPVAVADSYSTNQDTALVVPATGVLGNDADAQSDPLTAVLNAGPAHGSLTLNANGGFTYTPATGYSGADSFTYHAYDGTLGSNIVTVGLTVNAVASGSFVNGSFEAGATGWTLAGNCFVYSSDASYIASDGTKMVVMNGGQSPPNAVVSQTFTTIPGQSYVLDYDLGILALNSAEQKLRVEITGTTPRLSQLDSVFGNGLGNSVWSARTHAFTADSATTTLTFRDQSVSTNLVDLMLDHVRVTAVGNPVNTAPVALADSYSTNQETQLVIPAAGVLGNDVDAQSDPLTAVLDAGPAHGILALNANGGFTYTPAAGYNGPDSFTYHANDGNLDSNVVTVGLTVNAGAPGAFVNGSFEADETGWSFAGNCFVYATDASYIASDGTKMVVMNGGQTPPNAVISQTFTTVPGQSYVVDYDLGILALNFAEQKLRVQASGTASLLSQVESAFGNGLGNTVWSARSHTFTADSVTTTLTFRDESASTNLVDLLLDHVRITAVGSPVNTAPVAVADSYATNQNTQLVVAAAGVLQNDSDAQNDPLTAALVSGPAHGSLTLNPNGGFNYMPATGYSGADSFTYRANDGNLNSNTVTVALTINAVNTAPVAVADSYAINQNTQLVVPAAGVLQNDSDAQNDPLTAALVSGPAHGTLTLNPNGGFTYMPATGYNGADSFTYRANDGSLNSNTVTVALTINAVNTAPVAVADSYATNQNTQLVVPAAGVLQNDSDAQNDPLTAALVSGPAHGSLTLNPNGGFNYMPATGYSGADSFTYRANDGNLNSNTVTVALTINAVNTAPVAVADSYATNQNTQLVVAAAGVLQNDSDAQNDALTAALVSGPAHGTLTLNPNGGFSYMPATGYSGADSFTYRANDGNLNSNTVTVALTINAVNTAPVAVADSYATNMDTPLSVPAAGVLQNDSDAQNNPLTAALVSGPAHGSLILNPNGGFTYTPDAGYIGADSFTYQANDGNLDSNTVTVNIAVNNAVIAEVLLNGSFESGFAGWSQTGNLSIETAAPYPATDGTKLVAFNSHDQTPNGVLFQSFPTVAGQTYTLSFDTGVLSFVRKHQKLAVTVSGAEKLVSRTIVLKGVDDGIARWTSKTFTFVADSATTILTFRDRSSSTNGIDLLLDHVRVTGPPAITNGAPVAVADSYAVNKDTPLVVASPGVLANDSDPQFQTQTAVLDAGPSFGSLTLDANGGFTYQPNAGYTGPDSFTYHATDGSLDSNTVTVEISVNEVLPGLLVNPSFEDGFAGWTTSGNQTIEYYPATEGIRLVAFNGDNRTPNAVLSQTFATTPGQSYTLTFDASVLAYTTDPQSFQVSVNGSANLLTETVTIHGLATALGPWHAQAFNFTADSASTTLEFRDQSPATIGLDLLLDNVRVLAGTSPVATAQALPPVGPTLVITPEGVVVSMTATEVGNYILERSTDMVNWEYVSNVQSSGPQLLEFHETLDPLGSGVRPPRMFYRFGFEPAPPTE